MTRRLPVPANEATGRIHASGLAYRPGRDVLY